MKKIKKIALLLLIPVFLCVFIACSRDKNDTKELKFETATLSTINTPNAFLLSLTTLNGGTIHYIIVDHGSTMPTPSQIIDGNNYEDVTIINKGHGDHLWQNIVRLEGYAGLSIDVHAVIVDGDRHSPITTLTNKIEGPRLVFAYSHFQSPSISGAISFSLSTYNGGMIYYIIVDYGHQATVEQIVNGVNYDDVIVYAANSSPEFENELVENLTPDVLYVVHAVIIGENNLHSEILRHGMRASVSVVFEHTLVESTKIGELDLTYNINYAGIIYYIIVPMNSTAPTARQIIIGTDYNDVNVLSASDSPSFDNHLIKHLTPGLDVSIYAVGVYQSSITQIIKHDLTIMQHTFSLAFASAVVKQGSLEGTIEISYTTLEGGTIYLVVIDDDATAPTAEQIVAGVDYDDVVILGSANATIMDNLVISGIQPGKPVTVHAVVTDENGNYSNIREQKTHGFANEIDLDILFMSGENDGEIDFQASSSLIGSTIHYVIFNQPINNITMNEILNPNQNTPYYIVHGHDFSIDLVLTYESGATYYLYALALNNYQKSPIIHKHAIALEIIINISGSLTMGVNEGELVINLHVDNPFSTIYYAVSDTDSILNISEIMSGSNSTIVYYNNELTTNIIETLELFPGNTYYLNAVAIVRNKASNLLHRTAIAKPTGPLATGDGTLANPFILRTALDVQAIGSGDYNDLLFTSDAHYILENDIDLSSIPNFIMIPSLSGSLNGSSYIINNLNIDHSNIAGTNSGFINSLSGHIYNITFANLTVLGATSENDNTGGIIALMENGSSINELNIINANVRGIKNVGGVAGRVKESTTLSHIYFNGSVYATIGYVGGLIGTIESTTRTVETMVNLLNVVVEFSRITTPNTGLRAGGLVGHAEVLNITNAVINAYVYSKEQVSLICGLAGTASAKIGEFKNILVAGRVNWSTEANVGFFTGNGRANASYANLFATQNSQRRSATPTASQLSTTGDNGRNAGALINNSNLTNATWYQTNMPGFLGDDNAFELIDGNARPTLKNSLDNAIIDWPA